MVPEKELTLIFTLKWTGYLKTENCVARGRGMESSACLPRRKLEEQAQPVNLWRGSAILFVRVLEGSLGC